MKPSTPSCSTGSTVVEEGSADEETAANNIAFEVVADEGFKYKATSIENLGDKMQEPESSSNTTQTLDNIRHRINPTDRGHFKDVDILSDDEKRFIISFLLFI